MVVFFSFVPPFQINPIGPSVACHFTWIEDLSKCNMSGVFGPVQLRFSFCFSLLPLSQFLGLEFLWAQFVLCCFLFLCSFYLSILDFLFLLSLCMFLWFLKFHIVLLVAQITTCFSLTKITCSSINIPGRKCSTYNALVLSFE